MVQKKIDYIPKITNIPDCPRSGELGKMIKTADRHHTTRIVIATVVFSMALALGQGAIAPSQLRAQDTPASDPIDASMAPGGFYSNDSPIVRVVERVKDAVVNIEAEIETVRSGESAPHWLPFFNPRSPRSGKSKSFGSGFLIRDDGTVLTNAHVVYGATRIEVRLSDKTVYEATVLGIDPETDLAVIKINTGHKMNFIELGDSEKLRIGQWVVAIGNPFPRQKLDRTVTVGVISGIGRSALNFGEDTPAYQNYIQTDAAINPGNSGGPLIDLSGKVVGVNAAIASPSGGNVGIGFAIPVTYVKAVLDDLITKGRVSRGWLGIRPGELTPDMALVLEIEDISGIVVQDVIGGTPASRSGLKQGDVIIRFNGESIVDVPQFMFLVAQIRPKTAVDVDIVRNGNSRTLAVILEERPEQGRPFRGDRNRGNPDSWFGMRVRTVTAELAERYSVDYGPGVIVTEVEPGSPADRKGIVRGNIIRSIQREEVSTASDFRQVRKRLEYLNRPILFLIIDNTGQQRFVALKIR